MTDTLDFSSRAVRPLDFSSRARPTGPVSPSPLGDGSMAGPRQRDLGERFTDVVTDAARRNPLIAITRAVTDAQPVWEAGAPMFSGGLLPRWEDKPLTVRDPGTGEALTYRSPGQQMRDTERERRDSYETRAQGDGWRQARGGLLGQTAAGATNLSGALVGAMADPVNLIAPGKTILGRIIGGGAVNAAGDVVTQSADIGADLQRDYSPVQTLVAGALGAGIQTGFEVAPRAARAAVDGVRGGLDFSRRAIASVPNPLPDFSGSAMDTGAVPQPSPTRAAPVGLPAPSAAPSAPSFVAPVDGIVVSGFGRRVRPNARASSNHQGVDYRAAEGTAARAVADGEVIFAGPRGNYGNRVVIRHGDGTESSYSHLSAFDVGVGDRVTAGQTVARTGSTGNVTGPHLHLEILRGGQFIDPRTVIGTDAPTGQPAGLAEVTQAAPARGLLAPAPEIAPAPRLSNADLGINEPIPAAAPQRSDSFGRVLADIGDTLQRQAQPPRRAEPVVSVSRVAPEENAISPGLEGFRVDVPASAGRVLGAVNGEIRPDGTWRVRNAELPQSEQGRGLAVASYLQAAQEARLAGARLTSDAEVTPAAARVWEALGRRGVEVDRNPLAVEVSRAGIPDTMGMGPVSLRTPDGSPVFEVRQQGVSRPERARARGGLDFSARAVPEKLNIDMSAYGDRIGSSSVASSGQTVNGLRAAPRSGGIAAGAGDAYAGRTVPQLADDLRSALGLTHRQGRVSMRRAAGEYDTGSGVIRTRAVDEMDVISHEAFHAFEYERQGPALKQVLADHSATLKRLAYDGAPANVARQEGFAEFGRWYLTNPDHARKMAPDFFDAFEAALAKDAPEALARMQDIQTGYQNILRSASIDVAKGSIAYTGSRGPIRNLIDEVRRNGPGSAIRRLSDIAYTWFVDDLHPLSVAERRLTALYAANSGAKLDLKRAASPYALARLSREAYAAGHNDLMNGVTPYRGVDPVGPSLAEALEKAGLDKGLTGSFKNDALRTFDAYLIARRMVHEWDRYAAGDLPNPPDRHTKQFHEQVIADSEAAHPTFADAAKLTYQWLENLWRKEFEAGLITKASYDHGLTAHPDYVPLMRDMSDKGPGKGGRPRGAMQFAGGVKQFEGSSRDIISPLSSMMRRSYELGAIIKRNDTMKALDDLAQAAGRGAGAIVERLPAKEMTAYRVNAADALQKTAAELGVSGRDLSTVQKLTDDATNQDAMITLFKQSEFSPRKGEAVVFVWRDGEKTPLLLPDGEFGQSMFQALAGMNKDLSNVVVDSMAAATQLLRYGVTLSPEFMAANLVRDALATWINTDVGFVPGFDTIRGAAAEVAQGQMARRYANAGGMRGGANVAATSKPFPKTDAEAEVQLQHLRRKGWKVKRYASWRGLAELTDLSETSTRMGVFKLGFDKAKRQGLSDYEAIIESGFTSRDYLDFARRGSKMLTASRIVTFLNAALQGLDKSVRVLTSGGNLKRVLLPLTKEARTPAEKAALGHAYKAWAKVSALGALGLGLRMLYADDPEYQEINDRLRATHWIFRTGGQWVFVPKPFELATISNILERGYEGTVLKDPTAGERLLSDFRHTIAPPSEIPALSIPFAIGANRDYLGRPIVPDHLRGAVDPQYQFNSFTSDLGKLIGRTFNVSPAVVDYVVTGLGGSLGRYVLQGSNIVGEAVTGRPRTAAGPEDMFLARRFIRAISRGSVSQAEFWDQVSRDGGDLTRAEGSFRNLMRDGKDEEAIAYLNRLPALERGFVTLKVFGGEGESIIHPMVRAQKAVGVLSDFRTDVREGELRDDAGAVIPLTPQDRRNIDTAVAEFAQAEMRNALIATGVKGWAQKAPMRGLAIAQRIQATNPAAYRQLQLRLQLEKAPTSIWPEMNSSLDAMWGQLRQPLSGAVDPGRFIPALRQRRLENADGATRYEEAQRVVGGGYAPAPASTARPLDFSARAQ